MRLAILFLVACPNASPQVTTVTPPIVTVDAAPIAFVIAPDAGTDAKPKAPVYVDATDWVTEHGGTSDGRIEQMGGCAQYTLGAPPHPALVCSGGAPMFGSLQSGESIFSLDVIWIEKGKIVSLLRVPIIAGPLDRLVGPDEVDDDPDHGNYIELKVDVDPTGMKLTIAERPGDGCAEHVAKFRKLETKKGELNGHIKMIDAACRSRGTYVFKDNAFTKAN